MRRNSHAQQHVLAISDFPNQRSDNMFVICQDGHSAHGTVKETHLPNPVIFYNKSRLNVTGFYYGPLFLDWISLHSRPLSQQLELAPIHLKLAKPIPKSRLFAVTTAVNIVISLIKKSRTNLKNDPLNYFSAP